MTEQVLIPKELYHAFSSRSDRREWQVRFQSASDSLLEDPLAISRLLSKLVLDAIQREQIELLRWIMEHHQEVAMRNEPTTYCARAAYQGNLDALELILGYYPDLPEEDIGPIFLEGCAGGQLDVAEWIFDEYGMAVIGPDWDRAIRTSIQSSDLAVLRWLLVRTRVTGAYRATLVQFTYEHVFEARRAIELAIIRMATLELDEVRHFTLSQIEQMILRNQVPDHVWIPLILEGIAARPDSLPLFRKALDLRGFTSSELNEIVIGLTKCGMSQHVEHVLTSYQVIGLDYQAIATMAFQEGECTASPISSQKIIQMLIERYPVDLSVSRAEMLCNGYYLPDHLREAYQAHTRDAPLLFLVDRGQIILASLEPMSVIWDAYPVEHDGLPFVVYWEPRERIRGGSEPPISMIRKAHRILASRAD